MQRSLKFVVAELQSARKKIRNRFQKKHFAKIRRHAAEATQALPSKSGSVPFSTLLLKQSQKAKKRAEGALRHYREQEALRPLHEFRIQLKKWRYLREIEAACLDNPPAATLASMKTLQDYLGETHDLEVLHQALQTPALRRKAGKQAQKDLQSFSDRLESEVAARCSAFLKANRRVLAEIFEDKAS